MSKETLSERVSRLEDQVDFLLSIIWGCEATKEKAREMEELFDYEGCTI